MKTQKEIMMEVRKNHAILLYESMKLRRLIEQIELSFTVIATESGATMIYDPNDPKPEGYQDGTFFHISEKLTKKGEPFKDYKRSRLRITMLDDKGNKFYKLDYLHN